MAGLRARRNAVGPQLLRWGTWFKTAVLLSSNLRRRSLPLVAATSALRLGLRKWPGPGAHQRKRVVLPKVHTVRGGPSARVLDDPTKTFDCPPLGTTSVAAVDSSTVQNVAAFSRVRPVASARTARWRRLKRSHVGEALSEKVPLRDGLPDSGCPAVPEDRWAPRNVLVTDASYEVLTILCSGRFLRDSPLPRAAVARAVRWTSTPLHRDPGRLPLICNCLITAQHHFPHGGLICTDASNPPHPDITSFPAGSMPPRSLATHQLSSGASRAALSDRLHGRPRSPHPDRPGSSRRQGMVWGRICHRPALTRRAQRFEDRQLCQSVCVKWSCASASASRFPLKRTMAPWSSICWKTKGLCLGTGTVARIGPEPPQHRPEDEKLLHIVDAGPGITYRATCRTAINHISWFLRVAVGMTLISATGKVILGSVPSPAEPTIQPLLLYAHIWDEPDRDVLAATDHHPNLRWSTDAQPRSACRLLASAAHVHAMHATTP